jgi:hypothetical protein
MLLVGVLDRPGWVGGRKVVVAQLFSLIEAMGGEIAHAICNCWIVSGVGQAKQCLGLFDEKVRVQETPPVGQAICAVSNCRTNMKPPRQN